MSKIVIALVVLLSAVCTGLDGQVTPSPYVGLEGRAIKSLSVDEVDALLAGEGMGLALAAELNGYPGPRHVLDLADSLMLTPAQIAQVEVVFDRMAGRAKELGAEIVELEILLDGVFATRQVGPDTLIALTSVIAEKTGALRATHLAAHLDVLGLLTQHQVMTYQRLRGYGDGNHVHRGVHEPS